MSADLQAKYLEAQIQTATPEMLITMLYDGAIRFLRQAKAHISNGKLAEGNTSLQRAEDIILELNHSLDMSRGEIAQNLRQLYEYMLKRTLEANTKKDLAAIDEVISLLSGLREAWVEAIKTVNSTRRSAAEAAQGTTQGINRSI